MENRWRSVSYPQFAIETWRGTWANSMELAYMDASQQMEHWVFLVQIKYILLILSTSCKAHTSPNWWTKVLCGELGEAVKYGKHLHNKGDLHQNLWRTAYISRAELRVCHSLKRNLLKGNETQSLSRLPNNEHLPNIQRCLALHASKLLCIWTQFETCILEYTSII